MARLIVEESMKLKSSDKVLITTDTGAGDYLGMEELIQALFVVMTERGIDPAIITYEAREKKGAEIPPVVMSAILDSDAVISLNSLTYLHSLAFPKILARPIKFLLIPPGASVTCGWDCVYRMLPRTREELYSVAEKTLAVANRLRDAPHKVHFTASNGTDVTFSLGKLKAHLATGVFDGPGFEILPNGQMALGVDEGSANGVVVVDAEMALIHRLLKDPVTFRVNDGVVTSVEGEGDAQIVKSIIDSADYPEAMKMNFAEFGLGLNKNALLNGDTGEGEHIYGAAHIGIGANVSFGGNVSIPAWHFDSIIPKATVEVDGKLLVKDGEYIL